ncbi:MAG: translation initiation factor IF-3 [Verrucomicrobia bacterium]|jgi:translation initiation factor IF-3|nr:translation initiation factor IF-3 [Verrucomicrobiota bacterium]MDA0906411.1 translation initiation factor IF-3 [Verrucomicrobiota bacterium]MDA1078300.1 translation initiation factor IF-3 [Verrucomicrobiota bacterium]NDH16689.1 translation initiation factor IF-3 [Opitutae bacterium]
MAPAPRGKNNKRFSNRNYIRKNDKIRAREVRVIGSDGEMLGVMPPEEAVKIAKAEGLDLVEVAANAHPPVCRILEFGKYKYELSKNKKNKEKSAKRIKEAKFRPRIEEHDYVTKLRRSEKFLHQGNKLKVTLMFRGREMEHINIGMDVVKRAIQDLSGVGRPDDEPKLSGRFIIVNLSPLPQHNRILKYNSVEEAESEVEEEDDSEDSVEELAEE